MAHWDTGLIITVKNANQMQNKRRSCGLWWSQGATQEFGGTWKGEPFLKKGGRNLREGNRRLVYQFTENNLNDFGLRWLLRKFSLSATAYYNYLKHSKNQLLRQKIKIQEATKTGYHACGGTSGYRLIRDLLFQDGIKISYTAAYNYMSELGLKATILRKNNLMLKASDTKSLIILLTKISMLTNRIKSGALTLHTCL